jgi:hypothetical protein
VGIFRIQVTRREDRGMRWRGGVLPSLVLWGSGETWSVSGGHASDSNAARADSPDACPHAYSDVYLLAAHTQSRAHTHKMICISRTPPQRE